MRVIHWTGSRELYEDPEARPQAIEPGGGQGEGFFVYPVHYAVDWSETRWPTEWEIAPRFAKEVQRFRRGEFGPGSPPHKVVELFVPAKHLHRLRRVG